MKLAEKALKKLRLRRIKRELRRYSPLGQQMFWAYEKNLSEGKEIPKELVEIAKEKAKEISRRGGE